MDLLLKFLAVTEWPPLAWPAKYEPGNPTVTVLHGGRIEKRTDWFCEAVWTGDFADSGREHSQSILSTLSSGYDSSAVNALVRKAGCEVAISFDRAEGGQDDSGAGITQMLGLRIHRRRQAVKTQGNANPCRQQS